MKSTGPFILYITKSPNPSWLKSATVIDPVSETLADILKEEKLGFPPAGLNCELEAVTMHLLFSVGYREKVSKVEIKGIESRRK